MLQGFALVSAVLACFKRDYVCWSYEDLNFQEQALRDNLPQSVYIFSVQIIT